MAAVSATRAAFNPATQHRRAMIGKIKIAQKQLDMLDDDYRQLLMRVTGRTSAADCSEPQLAAMLDALKAMGFKEMPARPGGKGKAADTPVAKKARALWISLYQLGAIDNANERALEAFARRQLGERLQWANQAHGYKLIEALKAIAERHGWSMGPVAIDAFRTEPASVRQIQERLCQTILAKLKKQGWAPDHWSLPVAAFALTGEEPEREAAYFTAEQLTRIAAKFGELLRTYPVRPGGGV